jgi:hypothetical protein
MALRVARLELYSGMDPEAEPGTEVSIDRLLSFTNI